MSVADYYNRIKKGKDKDYCPKCRRLLNEETCLKKYGVKHPMQNKEVYQKSQKTLETHYGVRYMQQSDEIKQKTLQNNLNKFGAPYATMTEPVMEKIRSTCLQKYGVNYPMQHEGIYQKSKETMQRKYGVDNPLQYEEFVKKVKMTNLQKYGVENPMSNVEIQKKALRTMTGNNNIKTSKPQKECAQLLQEIYPNIECDVCVGPFCLDFVLNINDCKIDIEYDGSYWHNNINAQRKDMIRDKVLQKQYNFKTLRIKSGYLIPTKEQVITAVNDLINNNKNYTHIILEDWG